MNGCFWPEAAIGFAENHANRIAALRAEAAIGPTELSIAASAPKRNSNLLRLLFYGMSLVYANGAKQQIAVTEEKL